MCERASERASEWSLQASEWMSRVRASQWIDVWVEKSECVSERASERANGFRVAAGHICGRNLITGFQNLFSLRLNARALLSDYTLEISETTVVIVQTGPVSYVARD